MKKKHVFIVGSKGIPANYGGFETFVDKLTENRKNHEIQYHVSCIGNDDTVYEYNGAECFGIKVPETGSAKAVYYDMKALQYCIDYCRERPEIEKPVFYVLACRIGPFIFHYKKQIVKSGGKLYVNPDGHEWKRGKWNALIRKYWKVSEKLMVKHADLLVCDSKNIERYIQNEYGKYCPRTVFIAYGADVEKSDVDEKRLEQWYVQNEVKPHRYYLVVGRFVPENNFQTIIGEFMKSSSDKDLVIITTANEKYLNQLERKLNFRQDKRIKFVGTVYEQKLLKKIRELAYGYIHGHEVGGTNPSLLEALGSTELNLLLNVGFNREVAEEGAIYWEKECGNLAKIIDEADRMSDAERKKFGSCAKAQIRNRYSWNYIVDRYEKLFWENGEE